MSATGPSPLLLKLFPAVGYRTVVGLEVHVKVVFAVGLVRQVMHEVQQELRVRGERASSSHDEQEQWRKQSCPATETVVKKSGCKWCINATTPAQRRRARCNNATTPAKGLSLLLSSDGLDP